jgi:hypothetical protein
MTKVEQLNAKMYKLLANHPYNVVRTQCDRIGRQIQELDKKPRKAVQA